MSDELRIKYPDEILTKCVGCGGALRLYPNYKYKGRMHCPSCSAILEIDMSSGSLKETPILREKGSVSKS
jgi:hypothetical protein